MHTILCVLALAYGAALQAADAAVGTSRYVEGAGKPVAIAIGVYIQIGQHKNIDLIMRCITNIARARERSPGDRPRLVVRLGIHVSYVVSFDVREQTKLDQYLRSLQGVDTVHSTTHANKGFDVLPFLSQLTRTVTAHPDDLIFKIHTKSNEQWLQHTIQCMCGSVDHVSSIIEQFVSSPRIGMLAPRGTAFGSRSERNKVAPFLLRLLFNEQELWLAFEDRVILGMTDIWRLIFRDGSSISREEVVIVAGTMFWARRSVLQPALLGRALPLLAPNMSTAYRPHGAVEHLLERLLPTMVERFGYTVREMDPAPAVILGLPSYRMCTDVISRRLTNSSIYGISLTYKRFHSDHKQQYKEYRALRRCAASGVPFIIHLDCCDRLREDTRWRDSFDAIWPLLKHNNYITREGKPVVTLELPSVPDRAHAANLLAFLQVEARARGVTGGLNMIVLQTSDIPSSFTSSTLSILERRSTVWNNVSSLYVISEDYDGPRGKLSETIGGGGRNSGSHNKTSGGHEVPPSFAHSSRRSDGGIRLLDDTKKEVANKNSNVRASPCTVTARYYNIFSHLQNLHH